MAKLNFKKKNLISCTDVSFYRIIFEYMCWVLGGKPDNHNYEEKR